MATVMDIMRINLKSKHNTVQRVDSRSGARLKLSTIVLSLSAATAAMPVLADFKITPSLSLNSYAYQVKVADEGTDEGLAQAVTPTLNLAYNSSWLQ